MTNAPQTYRTIIRGVSFLPQAQQDVYYALKPGQQVVLERDPSNQFDGNAIRVLTEAKVMVGHVAKEEAARLAPLMDAGVGLRAMVLERPSIEIEVLNYTGHDAHRDPNVPGEQLGHLGDEPDNKKDPL